MDGTVLIAEDDPAIRKVLTQALHRAGCRVHATSLLSTLGKWVGEGRGDLVISDVAMPDGDGLDTLLELKKTRPELPFIVISAQNTITTAIRAEETAAFAYLPKPFDLSDLLRQARTALGQGKGRPVATADGFAGEDLPLVGRSPAMQSLYRQMAKLLNSSLSVQLVGETGTGKSLVAGTMHDLGDRAGLPLVTIGATGIKGPEDLAATIATARGGTLVLDEVGDLGPAEQLILVRALDNFAEPTPRLVSTTASSPDELVRSGNFRPDLHYRLCEVPVAIPPLRERVDDIPLLADHFLAAAGSPSRRHFGPPAHDLLKSCRWPGNVRQLRSIVQRLALTSSTVEIGEADVMAVLNTIPGYEDLSPLAKGRILPPRVAEHIRQYFAMHGNELPPEGVYPRFLRELERPLLEAALDAVSGNQVRCARLLGMNRNTLRKKMAVLGIAGRRRGRLP